MDDSDKECQEHARQLCKEALQEGVFNAQELQSFTTQLSPESRVFLKDILQDYIPFLPSETPTVLPSEPLPERRESIGIPQVIQIEIDETDLFLPSDVLPSLEPLPSTHFDVDFSLVGVLEPIQILLKLLQQLQDDSLFSDLFEEELRDGLKAFHQIVTLFDNVCIVVWVNCRKMRNLSLFYQVLIMC